MPQGRRECNSRVGGTHGLRGMADLARKGHVSKYLKVSIHGQAWTVHLGVERCRQREYSVQRF